MSSGLRIGRLSRWVGIVAIALLAMAATAQAKGEWKIAEQTMDTLEASEASIFGTATETFKLSVAWYASEIECSTLGTEAPTKIFVGGTSEAILKFSSCQVLGPPFVAETCKVVEPIELKVAGELLLHGTKTYELFKPATGESLGSIKFKEGTECPLPLINELKGTFVGETEAGERKEQPLAFSSTIEALFGSDSLSFGTHPATLKGKSTWALAAGYKGLKWSAVGGETSKEEKEKLEEEKELVKWTLLKNGSTAPNNLLNLSVTLLEAQLLVPVLSMTIKCTGGTATAHLVGGVVLAGTVHLSYTGCSVVGKSNCQIHSPGSPVGTILAEVESTASRNGEETLFLPEATEEEPFAEILAEDKTCSILGGSEEPARVYGTILLALLNSSTVMIERLAHLDDEELTFLYLEEEWESLIDGAGGVDTALTHMKEFSGGTWAIDFK